MNNIGIRIRVLLLTLVPLLVFSLVLGQYTVMTRIQDLESALQERGEAVARFLATESEFALFSEDLTRLEQIAHASLQGNDVQEVIFRDANRQILVHVTNGDWRYNLTGGDSAEDALLMTFSAPVFRTSIDIADHDEFIPAQSDPRAMAIGWVELYLSRQSTLDRQQAIIYNIVLIASVTALFSIMIALWMGRGIVRPIIRLSHAVDDMRTGRLETRVSPSTGGELGALEQGFNDMAEVMEQSQHRLHNEIRDATGKLRATIDELELKNTELDSAREKALAAGNEKASFLANMSHEIRTPINAILGYTSLLEKSGLSADQYEYARTISCASTQLLRVIDDILSFSKLESGTVQLDRSGFDLRDVLEDVLCMLGPEARDKQIELVLLIDSDVPLKLVGDAVRFRQVVINLMNNAIKFTDAGGVSVMVRLVAMDDNQVEIELQVVDTGIGIEQDVIDRIFGSFHQGDASISRRYGGTGLGLAIASRLVALWGGEIGVESEPGAGSTFRFTFKCELQASQDDHAAAPQLAERKILLYDDNPDARRAVRNLLLSWSINIFIARRRDQVGEMLHAAREGGEPFEMVVIGIGPEQDDSELGAMADLIRQQYGIPMLLMVNCRRAPLLGRSLSDAGLKIAIKPVRRDILHRKLCNLLGIEIGAGAGHMGGTSGPEADMAHDGNVFSGLRALIIEDNEFNRTLVTHVLEQSGVEVTQAATGDDALAQARTRDFDLVIMDLHLPGMDGAETTRRLRRVRPSLRHVPIIALTADVFFNDPAKLRESDIDACLLKPLEEARLWEAIRTLCVVPASEGGTPRPERPATIDDADFRANMMPKLLASLRNLQQRISTAAAADDREALAAGIHELKGIAGYFALEELLRVVEALEDALARGAAGNETLLQSIRELEQILRRLADAPA